MRQTERRIEEITNGCCLAGSARLQLKCVNRKSQFCFVPLSQRLSYFVEFAVSAPFTGLNAVL
jgi:hypothetical protein